ncbi:MAG: universal stress protein [Ginsengibacter sp.]
MKTIIVATDFSTCALNAANYAVSMASAVGADVLLFHVYETSELSLEIPVAIPIDNLRHELKQKLLILKNDLTQQSLSKINIRSEVAVGTFFTALEDVCHRINPYTVILGSQGTTRMERLFFGGHAVYTMKHLTWPLISVPQNAKFSPLTKIVLALDLYDEVDMIPMEQIKTLVSDFKAELHILVVDDHEASGDSSDYESALLLEWMTGIKPQYHFIASKHIDDTIIDFAEKNNIDLLIVLPKRYDLLNKLIHKSHTKRLVLYSPVPLMALHLS